ncbi:MAG: Ppx/GppA family phosphatase [Deltaproteobacteria bacterium]|nr:Ppx/GppA family phosphatase [Deltaproteobacteria bacterium]
MQQDLLAAVDLGSNSFHMVVARRVGDELQLIDRLREPVRLAAALDERGRLSREGMERALGCAARFGQRLQDADPSHVRAVGTATLRKARHPANFEQRVQEALGHEVEIISGREEARLVYLGVAHAVADPGGNRLVIDIGGASTECVLGEGFEPLVTESLSMGCVSWTRTYFVDGVIDRGRMREARLRAEQKLEPIARPFRTHGWTQALGSSGTIRAIAAIVQAAGWTDGCITVDALRRLRRSLYAAGHADRLQLPGLEADRAPVLAGGVALLSALFDGLGLVRVDPAPAALREGLLWDILGRIDHVDIRDRTINRMRERFVIDVEQARRVEQIALDLLGQVAPSWGLLGPWPRTLLSWAAQLHEVGLAVAYSSHHRHGAYLIEHSDMPGFSRADQRALASMVRAHRRKFETDAFDELPQTMKRVARDLTVLLRVAVRLCRARSPQPLPIIRANAGRRRLTVRLPAGWLDEHPLTAADLGTEADRLLRAGWKLRYT